MGKCVDFLQKTQFNGRLGKGKIIQPIRSAGGGKKRGEDGKEYEPCIRS
jgi:hypothetical protein